MTSYLNTAAKRAGVGPAQSEPLNERQVQNSAGGYSFPVDMWVQLDRFLILGTEGGSYYASEKKLTDKNVKSIRDCIKTDGLRTVARVVEISDAGRAPKNDPALFVLALCSKADDQKTRAAALDALPKVARIGTHLFHFAEFRTQLGGGWGKGMKRAISNWYLDRSPMSLQNQLVKYQSRDGWSHKDLLKLGHVNPSEVAPEKRVALAWAADKAPLELSQVPLIEAFERAKTLKEKSQEKELIQLITQYELTREMVPTEALNSAAVWEALLVKMPITALIRNLGNMTKNELLKPMSDACKTVVNNLTSKEVLKAGRVHPIQLLVALRTYASGHGMKSRGEGWKPVSKVVDALDESYYLAFANVEPTGKRWYLGLDVSGSMSGGSIAGSPLTPCEGAAAMSMVTAKLEEDYEIMAFDQGIRKLPITPKMRLDDIMKHTKDINGGGTDCALPMIEAAKRKIPVDMFVVYTDSETWAGHIHPPKALEQYRQKMGIPAKLVVCGMLGNNFSIADPNDAGMLDVVGFDTNVPLLLADFAKN
jgi:60 kDa SS-A/Ro ribonucleoprotein